MAERKIVVKWNKNTYDVDVSANESYDAFKARLHGLTGVPADRQKLLLKGKFLKDDAAVASVPVGAQVVLMGAADAIADAPSAPVVFAEDLSTEQKTRLNTARDPAGLQNLGNTCYMNSVLQALRGVTELRDAATTHMRLAAPAVAAGGAAAVPTDPSARVSFAFASLMDLLDKTEEPVLPTVFLAALRKAYPQFAELTRAGGGAQQDADECLLQLLAALGARLKSVPTDRTLSREQDNWVDLLMGAELTSSLASAEAPDEAPVVEVETTRRLKCTINIEVNFMIEGLKLALQEKISKKSPSLGREVVYTRQHALTSLPPYLTVQFERFFWKADTRTKSKILRKVAFPVRFDVFDLTGGDLRASLKARRALMLHEQDAKLGLPGLPGSKRPAAASPPAAAAMADTDDGAAPAGAAVEPHPLTSGQYELQSVVTHKGRDADSGHYIGWVKQPDGRWFKFDDAVVTEVKEAEIVALSGGGDWHMAYLVIYKRVDDVVEAQKEKERAAQEKSAAADAKVEISN